MIIWDLDRELYLIAGEKALRGLTITQLASPVWRYLSYSEAPINIPSDPDDSEIVRRAVIWRKLRARKEESLHAKTST